MPQNKKPSEQSSHLLSEAALERVRDLEDCLRAFMSTMQTEVIDKAEANLLKGEIADTVDGRLKKAIDAWKQSNRKLQKHR